MKNEALNTFIIEAVLIDPINDIIFKLKNKEFRDSDIRWLNDKLYKYTAVAAETLGIKFPEIELISHDGVLNDYTTERFIEAFTTLLNYFKSF
ncbi:MAG TPA: hypothetical protein PKW37_05010 [Salinivirgaceae bacterium]|nr:hypothetical protein [Salinivirgaceae bacterium]